MQISETFSSKLNQLRAEYAKNSSSLDLNISFGEYLRQFEVASHELSENSLFNFSADSSVSVISRAAIFADLLSLSSKNELLKRAELGDCNAIAALKNVFGCRAVYPGTFDPFTFGHLDVVRRAVTLFDHVVVAIGVNPAKSPLFSVQERIQLIKSDLSDLGSRVEVQAFEGSLVKFVRNQKCGLILRGIRSVTDYEQELQLALLNQTLSKGELETLFIPAREGSCFVSSSVVKSVIKVGEDASSMVSAAVLAALKFKHQQGLL